MHDTNIYGVDLNLLLVLDALCEEKNTVRAAQRLKISQPAVSHALGRLRLILKDPLFARASRGLVPTRRCLELQEQVKDTIKSVEKIFLRPSQFEPLTAIRTFRLSTNDLFEQIILPKLISRLGTEAPGITLISRPAQGIFPKSELEDGSLDLAVAGYFKQIPPRFYQQKLYQDDFVCVGQKKILGSEKIVSSKKYGQMKHLVISPQGDLQTFSKNYFLKKGINLKYVLGVSSFLSPMKILLNTDLILTCPRRLANSFCEETSLEMRELPFQIPPVQMLQVWHEQQHDDTGHQWLRKLVLEACKN